MTLAEARSLKEGDRVEVRTGNGWYELFTFKRLVKATTFPSMTFSDLMKGNFDLSKGKEVTEALCEDVHGKTHTFSTRKIQRVKEW